MYKLKTIPKDLSIKQLERAAKKHLLPYQTQNHDRFTSGRDHWHYRARGGRKDFIVHITKKNPPLFLNLMLSDKTKGKPVRAIVLNGRWVARCECMGQEVVDISDPLFVCLNSACCNISSGHYPRKVNFPSKKDRELAAEILLARPNPINRNWDRAGIFGEKETIKDLERENKKHNLKKVKVEEVN